MTTTVKTALLVTLLAGLAATARAGVAVGSGAGTIPDGGAGAFPSYGSPLVISFTVSGVAAPLGSVALDIRLTHTSGGELDLVLRAPGGAPSLPLVSLIGVTAPAGVGDSSNFSGKYGFTDAAAGANIWTVAYQLDGETGQYTVTSATRAISPTFDDWQLSNCGQASALGNLIDEVLDAVAGTYLLWSTLVGLKF